MKKEIAEKIVKNIMNDISNRSSIGDAMESIDKETYQEIVDTWVNICLNTTE